MLTDETLDRSQLFDDIGRTFSGLNTVCDARRGTETFCDRLWCHWDSDRIFVLLFPQFRCMTFFQLMCVSIVPSCTRWSLYRLRGGVIDETFAYLTSEVVFRLTVSPTFLLKVQQWCARRSASFCACPTFTFLLLWVRFSLDFSRLR